MSTIGKPRLVRLTVIEILTLGLLTLSVLPLGKIQGYSVCLGGLIPVIGNAYFARLTFRHRGARQLKDSVIAMYRGETGKIVLSAVLFILVFVLVRPLGVIAFFCGYGVMVFFHIWLTARILKQYKP